MPSLKPSRIQKALMETDMDPKVALSVASTFVAEIETGIQHVNEHIQLTSEQTKREMKMEIEAQRGELRAEMNRLVWRVGGIIGMLILGGIGFLTWVISEVLK
jgi:hypothetical protein